ncbi:MAG: O-acetyl-ADP-ribose deacetylase [Gammaproteobacteria bacterium]|nr:O-acetyl-ADP-ribose deacetylase [Gammaproteobacteria bacterium]
MYMIELIKADLTSLSVDAIVNAANSSLMGGGGVDGAIHASAGPQLLEACRKLGGCQPGDVKMTAGFNLPAKIILHTVGPIWRGGRAGERAVLSCCYEKSLQLGLEEGVTSIAFPSISTGAYGYPKRQAAVIALTAMTQYSERYETIICCCFNDSDLWVYQKVMGTLERRD